MYPKTIENLIECFKSFPGIGDKTAERLAFSTIDLDEEQLELFADSIKNVKNKIVRCKKCNHLTENEICDICQDKTRNNKLICVVENPKNVVLFEKTGTFNGLYHVLNGLISPLEGINPEDINIESLIKRVEEEDINEIIVAVKPSIEGETTSLYLKKILSGMNVIVSKIAHGIPMGADMEYIDGLTLGMALEDRKIIE